MISSGVRTSTSARPDTVGPFQWSKHRLTVNDWRRTGGLGEQYGYDAYSLRTLKCCRLSFSIHGALRTIHTAIALSVDEREDTRSRLSTVFASIAKFNNLLAIFVETLTWNVINIYIYFDRVFT